MKLPKKKGCSEARWLGFKQILVAFKSYYWYDNVFMSHGWVIAKKNGIITVSWAAAVYEKGGSLILAEGYGMLAATLSVGLVCWVYTDQKDNNIIYIHSLLSNNIKLINQCITHQQAQYKDIYYWMLQ